MFLPNKLRPVPFVVLDDPKKNQLRISGISRGYFGEYAYPTPIDPDRAQIWGGALRENRWNADFHMANLLEPDWNRQAGERIGYPIHVHCWLLLDRFIGHAIVKQNLRLFVQVIEEFWKANRKEWAVWILHFPGSRDPDIDDCYEKGVHWLKRQSDPTKPMKIRGRHGDEEPGTTHWPANPLRILDIQKLIERVTQSHDTVMKPDIRKPRRLGKAADLPLDIAVVIIDIIYKSQPHSRERIEDTRNILDAFEWKLPNAYWQSRCNPELVFEVGDLIKAEHIVDWANFCLGLEELLLDEDWYCNSGLNNRGRTLKLIAAIKERFDKAIKQENGIVGQHNG
ncbi:hypothetical protein C8Q69DRAFT_453143 [Paecilomyces variotii]|uniref:Uncharacterized protein n=1 Tax=Byssochlamys spectabilis TaxID=264951 RepID=A0A443I790_BYSSP|nr:hypothetical protein C8Q69DRAFT_453143 [Paecilomyces variotii]KAJ9196238.1 hypothetical protein DTO032I3_6496 [Paecilomyces variotii]KAJ9223931.1 hypothetical protein DTO169C6_3801 [Paecilomyces variotii]KAJ9238260.1 hypothetical protein DTO169E5_4804 [Paecilomyces variotii]KAJ9264782.1 hypothetical protein DTO195F2_2233 [Paecilomyces variotii]KAJ9276452.1 hypothetical protein DTO021D3_6658 [Paecilomyces variotii]